MVGAGLLPNKETITKHANFGKNIILLDKLYYKNILSIKDKRIHSVEHLPNIITGLGVVKPKRLQKGKGVMSSLLKVVSPAIIDAAYSNSIISTYEHNRPFYIKRNNQ